MESLALFIAILSILLTITKWANVKRHMLGEIAEIKNRLRNMNYLTREEFTCIESSINGLRNELRNNESNRTNDDIEKLRKEMETLKKRINDFEKNLVFEVKID